MLCFKKNFNFNLLQSFPLEYSIWLPSLVLYVTKKYEEDFCSSEKMHDYCKHTSPIFKSLNVLKLQDIIFSILNLIYFYFNGQLPL